MTTATHVFLPHNLVEALESKLEENELTDYWQRFIDILIGIMLASSTLDFDIFEAETYTPISVNRFRGWVDGSYKGKNPADHIIRCLKQWNIIQCNNFYRTRQSGYVRGMDKGNAVPLGYRLHPCFFEDSTWCQVGYNDQPDPYKKKNLKRRNPGHSLAIDFLFDLTVDMEAVIKYCYDNIGMRLKPKKDKERWLTCARAKHWISLAMKVHLGHHYYKRDGDSRVYSTITSYPSKLKQFLRYKGEPLVNIDIANSQPLLLCLLPGFDDVQYKSDVQNGILYERLMVTAGLSDTIEEAKICFERDLVKTEFFQYVLYKKKGMPFDLEQRVVKAFAYIYPEAFEFIKGLSEKEHLAVQMQKTEADVMIDKVLKDLLIDFVPCVTIHDSVLSVQSNAECISGYILKHFTGGGVIPSLKIEYPSS